ncbi:hypothetical protein [Acinetobacter lwoffii]|nr:hypothetical protein [Acinetobacter lwoffii]ENW27271.1 hypothetical protein F924_02220 [Acinetobacter lwoffii ATCC 9957 = CIP 70.31]
MTISDEISSHKLYDVIENLKDILLSLKDKVDAGTAKNTDFYIIGEYAQQVATSLGLIVDPTEDGNMFVNLNVAAQARILYT